MNRRYDIDWIRVIAIGLLLLYHVAIGFQPWGVMIRFIANTQPWQGLWMPMTMLNVWRIPLLFFVSGMGVYFAMQKRGWLDLVKERAGRILVPFLFGVFAIVPLHVYLWQTHYGLERAYTYSPDHLWFLGNIFCYVVILSPVFYYLKHRPLSFFAQWLRRMLASPAGILVVAAALTAEVLIVKPVPFELYAMTWHGFVLGLIAFFFGFSFAFSGEPFWTMIKKWRWGFLLIAVALFALRVRQPLQWPSYYIPAESLGWILAVFAFGAKYLNRGSKSLSYLSEAAYPVYIIHMVFLYLGSTLIFNMQIPVQLQFVLVLAFTIGGCLLAYEFLIRRVSILRPLFGLSRRPKQRHDPKIDVDQPVDVTTQV